MDLNDHYKAKRIIYSLRTQSSREARSRALSDALKLDTYWTTIRFKHQDIPGQHLICDNPKGEGGDGAQGSYGPTLSEAISLYISIKGQSKPETFKRAAKRSCGYVIKCVGNKCLADFTRTDANKFRDYLLKRGLTGSSITRIFGTVRSVFNFSANESGLSLNNPFSGVYYDRNAGVTSRNPIPLDKIRYIQNKCVELDDELRWLVALVSDTGMRLAEASGLLIDDLVLDKDIPFVIIQKHPWRGLKTIGSERKIPLVGVSLWGAQKIKANQTNDFAFPRYNKTSQTNSNSASASLNKWIKQITVGNYSMHSFRHSLRDRLRAIECPFDIADRLGGWATEGIGQGYGDGYELDVLFKWLQGLK